jgi:hypothetical protein
VPLVLVAAFTLSCGRSAIAPPTAPPVVPLPPRVEAVFPPARSAGVLYDTAIWVQFAVAVDTASISDRTVFFKADTQRLPATLSWDPATRRLSIVPNARLGLRKTYTIELTPALRFVDGSTLLQQFVSQFTTNSLRRPSGPLPADGRLEQSPFVAVRWGGLTESSAGPVSYEIHVGPDSASATDPMLPGVGATPAPPFVPRTRWSQAGTNYWAVHAINTATGERLVGPVWRFTTFPANAAYDSIAITVTDWNWVDANSASTQHCSQDSLVMSPTMVSTIRWNLAPLDTTVRLTGAAILLSPRLATIPAVAGPSVWDATGSFPGCAHGYPGPPTANVKLADATVVAPDRIRFSSDALAAHLEATRRFGGRYGYLFRAPLRRSYYGGGTGTSALRATMMLYVYRPPPTPAALAAVRAGR